jgi:hypothetical protein
MQYHAFLVMAFALLAAASAAAISPAEQYAKKLADQMQSQIPVQVGPGAMIVDVKSQGGTVTIEYKFQATSESEEEIRRGFIREMCGHRSAIYTVVDLGGTVVAMFRLADRTFTTTLTSANCAPPPNARTTRADLQNMLSSMKFPVKISSTSSIIGGQLGDGVELIYFVEQSFSRLEAEQAKASSRVADWIAEQRRSVCQITSIRNFLEGGATMIYRYQAQGVVIADVRVDIGSCKT